MLNLLYVDCGNILPFRFKYRDRATIVADILDTIRRDPKGKTKTSIMRASNLNFDQVNVYLHLLVLRGIVKAVDPLRSQEVARYKLTGKGLRFLEDFDMWHPVLATSGQRIM